MCSFAKENSVRERILFLLKKHGPLAVVQLGKEMHLTPMAVRQHLFRLEHKGLVDHTTQENKTVRGNAVGRPVYLYHLTEQGKGIFPGSYENFLFDTFSVIEEHLGHRYMTRILKWRSEKMLKQAQKNVPAHKNIRNKLYGLKSFFEQNGHLLEIEEEHKCYRLKIFHCSIYKIAEAYNKVCGYEQEMLESILGRKILLEGTLAQKNGFCTFSVPSKLT